MLAAKRAGGLSLPLRVWIDTNHLINCERDPTYLARLRAALAGRHPTILVPCEQVEEWRPDVPGRRGAKSIARIIDTLGTPVLIVPFFTAIDILFVKTFDPEAETPPICQPLERWPEDLLWKVRTNPWAQRDPEDCREMEERAARIHLGSLEEYAAGSTELRHGRNPLKQQAISSFLQGSSTQARNPLADFATRFNQHPATSLLLKALGAHPIKSADLAKIDDIAFLARFYHMYCGHPKRKGAHDFNDVLHALAYQHADVGLTEAAMGDLAKNAGASAAVAWSLNEFEEQLQTIGP